MKKEWKNPRIINLSIEETKETEECECCGAKFDAELGIELTCSWPSTNWRPDKLHRPNCPNNPNNPNKPVPPIADDSHGGPIPTYS